MIFRDGYGPLGANTPHVDVGALALIGRPGSEREPGAIRRIGGCLPDHDQVAGDGDRLRGRRRRHRVGLLGRGRRRLLGRLGGFGRRLGRRRGLRGDVACRRCLGRGAGSGRRFGARRWLGDGRVGVVAVAVGSSEAGGSVSGATDSGASLAFGSANTMTSLPFDASGLLTAMACSSLGEPMIVCGSAANSSAVADGSGTIGQSTSRFGQTESTPNRP